MNIILSTRNPSKVTQIKAFFGNLQLNVLTLDDAGITGEAVEDGQTLEENARKKALFAWEHTPTWIMAEDTGFFIDALDGRPGIYAARWAGKNATTEDTMRYTLEKLRHVLPGERTATFKTVAVVIDPHGITRVFEGRVSGKILGAARTKCQPKMPYSAIFVPDGQPKVWAEMSVEEENAISHRGKAFRQVRDFFAGMLVT